MQVLSYNKKAKFNYTIEEELEAGLCLLGSEVKSSRLGRVNLSEGYITERNGELFLINCNISEYKAANKFNHPPKRQRKLLLHKKQISKLIGKMMEKGLSIVPIKMYLNQRNIIKLTIAVCKGKKLYDKRETIKKRDEERYQRRSED